MSTKVQTAQDLFPGTSSMCQQLVGSNKDHNAHAGCFPRVDSQAVLVPESIRSLREAEHWLKTLESGMAIGCELVNAVHTHCDWLLGEDVFRVPEWRISEEPTEDEDSTPAHREGPAMWWSCKPSTEKEISDWRWAMGYGD